MDLTGPWRDAARATDLLTADGVQPTIFARMSSLAAATGAMNLGQGFPDTDPPELVARTAMEAIARGANQYPPGRGVPALLEAIAAHQERFYGLRPDPAVEILVTTGATEAIAASILALVRPGDEVLTLEPYFDSYAATIALAGGVHRTIPLTVTATADDGELRVSLDHEAIRSAISDETRVLLLNTPHNPTGLVLDRATLEVIAEECAAHDVLIVSDEVYEHLAFDGAQHLPIAALPAARERTITIGSAGKTFSVTGWKIGWITAPPALVDAVQAVKQWLTFTSGAPFQPAVAAGLGMDEQVFAGIEEDLRERRDRLAAMLRAIGVRIALPQAGYFIVGDIAPITDLDAVSWCEVLPEQAGVVAIPVSAFCRPHGARTGADGCSDDGARRAGAGTGTDREPTGEFPARSLVRFAFCKDDATLAEADRRLRAWASAQG